MTANGTTTMPNTPTVSVATEQFREPEMQRERPVDQQPRPQGWEQERPEHESDLVEQQHQEGKEHDGEDLLSSHGILDARGETAC